MAIYLRDREQRWVVANAETCAIIGKTAEELVGRHDGGDLRARRGSRRSRRTRPRGHADRRGRRASTSSSRMRARARRATSGRRSSRCATPAAQVVGVGGVSLDVTDRERDGARAGRGPRALRDGVRIGAGRHARQPRLRRRHAPRSSSATPRSRACSAATRRSSSAASARRSCIPTTCRCARRMLDDVLAGRPASGEIRFKHRDGHDICALAVPSLTLGPDGERLIVLQAVDISERKRLETRAAAPRRPRRADRALQPPALRGGARARGQPRAAARAPGRAAAARPRRLQAGQRHASATPPATSC